MRPPPQPTPSLYFYRSATSLEFRLEELELYAIDRLRILKGISDGFSRGKRHEEMEKFGVGLKLDDALAFWKLEFSKKVGAERFDKEYSYGIRHNYGKEGKRTDCTPYSCQKIISSSPSVSDHHGCPYRHFSEDNLRAALGKMGIGGQQMEDVMDKVRHRHYQLACTLTYEAVHNISCDSRINHPNQYFSESRKALQPENQQTT